jgi:hypothetical protein
LQELRVRAYLDLLQERDSRDLPAAPSVPDQPPPGPGPDAPPSAGPDGPDGPDGPEADGGDGWDGGLGNGPGGPGRPGRNGPGGPGPAPGPDAGPSVGALVTLTVPLATWQGRSETPGQADGFGLLDGDDARDLVAAAARHPRTRWCVTAVNPDGTAVAHGCLPGRHPPPGTGPPLSLLGLNVRMTSVARGPCDHARAEIGYHPSRSLAHLIRARNGRCTAPGCGRPAARCDLDHTRPWDQGGPTCECNLAPPCKR